MDPTILKSLGLTTAERIVFPLEVDYLMRELALSRPLRRRELEDVLVIYRRAYSSLNEIERQLRPDGQLFMVDWLDRVLEDGTISLPDTGVKRLQLIRFSALGVEEEELAQLVSAWNSMPPYTMHEGFENIREVTLSEIREYLAYLSDFAPFMDEETNVLARQLLLQSEAAVSADLVARFLTDYHSSFHDKMVQAGERVRPYWMLAWFDVFRRHAIREEGLDEAYLDTLFNDVIRNVPAQVWTCLREDGTAVNFAFALNSPGFYYLAAGKSARKYLPEIGMTRGAWRFFLTTDSRTELSDMSHPELYLWARSLVDNDELARQIPAFMPARFQEAWEPILQQLGRLENVAWSTEEGERLLGYVYHIVRDQPDFRVDVHRPEALLEAAVAHYARIEQSLAAVQQRRNAAAEADREARAENQNRQEQRNLARQREYEAWLRKTKWAPLHKAKTFSHPGSKLRIQELTNGWELYLEGKAMGHCVADYARYCDNGRFSIWSLRIDRDMKVRSLVTIRIDVAQRQIVEARARFNRDPLPEYKKLVNVWAESNKIKPYAYWD